MHLISSFIVAVTWWQMRRVRRAGDGMRRARKGLRQADDLATRALRTLIAVGLKARSRARSAACRRSRRCQC